MPTWRLIFRLALLAYLTIISVLAFAPLSSTPGTGYDKVNHILAFFVLAGLADLAYPVPSSDHGWARWACLLGFGFFIEAVQYFLPYREFSLLDLAADGFGIWLYVAGVRFAFSAFAISARVGRTRP